MQRTSECNPLHNNARVVFIDKKRRDREGLAFCA